MPSPEKDLSRWDRWRRTVLSTVLSPLLPHEIVKIEQQDGLTRAKELVKDRYGLIVAYTHFSLRDGPEIMIFLAQQPVLKDRKIVSPIGFHQYREWIGRLADFAHITLFPIVTSDTLARPGYSHLRINDGVDSYIHAALDALDTGGIVPIALQTGRRSTLGGPTRALSMMMAQATRRQIERYGILFVGLDMPGHDDFAKARGYNPSKTYRLTIGNAYTAQEILRGAGNLREIDSFAFRKLAGLVQESYRGNYKP